MQYTATHCDTLQHTAMHCNTLQCTATHCNTRQHTATHCNTLQHRSSWPRAYTWVFLSSSSGLSCLTWPIHVCDMTNPCVWYDQSMCVIWPIHVCDMNDSLEIFVSYVSHDFVVFTLLLYSFSCVTWLYLFLCVTWLMQICDMTHSYSWHGSLIRVTSLFDRWSLCAMTYSYVTYDWFKRVTASSSTHTHRYCELALDVIHVLQCVAACCSVHVLLETWLLKALQCGAVWCSVVQCVAVCCSVLHSTWDMTP